MSLPSHSKLLGAVLFTSGFFIAYGVSEVLGGVVPAYARSIGCVTAGLVVGGVDLGLRHRLAEGDGWLRYLLPGEGAHISIVPVWIARLFFLLIAFAVVEK